MTIWDNLKRTYNSFSQKTGELTRIGRLKIEIMALKRDIEKQFVELGGRVYDQYLNDKQEGLFKDEKISNLVEKIKKLEAKLASQKQKLEKIKKEEGVDLD